MLRKSTKPHVKIAQIVVRAARRQKASITLGSRIETPRHTRDTSEVEHLLVNANAIDRFHEVGESS